MKWQIYKALYSLDTAFLFGQNAWSWSNITTKAANPFWALSLHSALVMLVLYLQQKQLLETSPLEYGK